jgi:hypothetical protein
MALVGAALSWPFSLKNSRPLPVSLAHAATWWSFSRPGNFLGSTASEPNQKNFLE